MKLFWTNWQGMKNWYAAFPKRLCRRGTISLDRCRGGVGKTGTHGAIYGGVGRKPLSEKKWEVPYQEFEELCAARSREAVSEQENTEKISDAEKTDMPQVASAERKSSAAE